ncbi:MAG: DUF4835 family protein [Muribaculaceae bacterium]|nr:DUF4835 family protein [Muribaculaceae bacterium]
MNWKYIIASVLVAFTSLFAMAQNESNELNCTVEINSQKVPNANKEVFNALKEAVSDYMNTTKWTDAVFANNERIQCKLFFTVATYDDGSGKMTGDLQIQSQRPVYNSSYMTTVINFKDTKVEFEYQSGQSLVFSEVDMESNLTAILNFYAYMIIAMDFDTFSERGGDPYYEKAANVVRLAQSSGETGWKAFEDTKNRSAVLSAFTDKSTSGIREVLYNYHRQGLDQMSVSVDKGRATITKSLETLKAIYDASPMTVCLSMFKDAKLDELVNVYSKANLPEKEKVYETLYPLWPTEQNRLNEIKKEATNN